MKMVFDPQRFKTRNRDYFRLPSTLDIAWFTIVAGEEPVFRGLATIRQMRGRYGRKWKHRRRRMAGK